jgi:hypothetical protein
VRCPAQDGGQDRFISLTEFLASQIFGAWEVVMAFDQGSGLRPHAGSDGQRHQEMMRAVTGAIGTVSST